MLEKHNIKQEHLDDVEKGEALNENMIEEIRREIKEYYRNIVEEERKLLKNQINLG